MVVVLVEGVGGRSLEEGVWRKEFGGRSGKEEWKKEMEFGGGEREMVEQKEKVSENAGPQCHSIPQKVGGEKWKEKREKLKHNQTSNKTNQHQNNIKTTKHQKKTTNIKQHKQYNNQRNNQRT